MTEPELGKLKSQRSALVKESRRSILMNQLDQAAQLGKPIAVEKLSHAMINCLREIGQWARFTAWLAR